MINHGNGQLLMEECIFWIEDVTFGYSQFIGGQSLRSGKLISNNGGFDSLSQILPFPI